MVADDDVVEAQPAREPSQLGGQLLRRLRRSAVLGEGAGDEQQPVAYAEDPKRDMAGVLERIEPFRWRLVIPWPQDSSKLNVFELKPVEQQPK